MLEDFIDQQTDVLCEWMQENQPEACKARLIYL